VKAKKFSGKFDVFALKHVMLEPERVMNASLQVKPASMHNSSVGIHDLQKGDHVTLID
jgi:hypothetical protein